MKRYNQGSYTMNEDPDGNWVRFDDVVKEIKNLMNYERWIETQLETVTKRQI